MNCVSRVAMAVIAGCVFGAASARADHAPVLVVPDKLGAPVIINGYDASWAVVDGDWGLDRPVRTPAVIYPYRAVGPYRRPPGYFPATGNRPRLGRYEIVPPANRRLPEPAESFHRFWSSQSEQTIPITEYPGLNPPSVIEAPRLDLPPRRLLPPLKSLD
ncbi:MAG: hypothetical protein QOJ96_2403 [Alphaproteobacteria bacterium]|nr:hypothetical protein [Alphaproteobacteria bacterium]